MAGAGKGKGKGPGVASGAVIGGLCLIGLVLFCVGVTVVISVISLYTSNQSTQPLYDVFLISSLGLKVMLASNTAKFYNSPVSNSALMSALCTAAYKKNSTAKNFAGCSLNSFTAYSATNNSSTSRRRRQNPTIGTVQIGNMYAIYSVSCGAPGDTNKIANSSNLNGCTQTRLAECNKLVGSTNFNSWQPVSSGTTQTIYDNSTAQYLTFTVTDVSGMPPARAVSYGSAFGLSQTVQSQLSIGCQYAGQVTAAAAAALLALGSNSTTQAATATTIPAGG